MNTLNELREDHVHLQRLLKLLEDKVARLREGTHPDMSLLSDVVRYIGDYASQHHHPREDEMFAHLRGRDAELDALFDRCEREHVELKTVTHELMEAVDLIVRDEMTPMDQFSDQLAAYVDAEQHHIDFEEHDLFPAIEQVATDGDWEELARALPRREDPLFGEQRAEEYHDLYEALQEDR